MPTAEQIRQFLVGVVLPPIAGVLATWIISTVHVLNLFGITSASLAGELVSLGTFGVVTLLGYLTSHHILSGHYTPAAKAAQGAFTPLQPIGQEIHIQGKVGEKLP